MHKEAAIKHREYIGNNTRLVAKLPMAGYVVKPEHLERLHSIIQGCDLFTTSDEANTDCMLTYRANLENGSVIQFHNLAEVLHYPNTSPDVIEGLRISRLGEEGRKVEVELSSAGEVIIDACGSPNVADSVVHTISQHLRSINQQFSAAVNTLILSNRPRRFATFIVVWMTLALLFFLWYYLYALNVGVDVSADLIPPGMTYYQRVEDALRSEEIRTKLDVLLLGQFRGFTNVTDYLQNIRSWIVACLIIILIVGAAAWISKHLKQYYPSYFFAIGYQQEMLQRIEKRRELWLVGIIIGFIVNIVASIVIAVFGG